MPAAACSGHRRSLSWLWPLIGQAVVIMTDVPPGVSTQETKSAVCSVPVGMLPLTLYILSYIPFSCLSLFLSRDLLTC